jgi:aryl-alcohol dehydrogenase-like predicted oxidoreductase
VPSAFAAAGMLVRMSLPYVDRVILGCWQLARGHGRDVEDAMDVLEAHYAAGFRVFDCADIYTGVEASIGAFARAHALGPDDLRVHTKYVPDLADLATLRPSDVERAVDRSRERLGRETLDLVQLHWWDDAVPGQLEVLATLRSLQERGALRAIGLTNVDGRRLHDVTVAGISIASVQTQYSLLDRRPADDLAPAAATEGIDLLCYGSVAGGLLSDRYLGRSDVGDDHENRSLTKYRLIVEEAGGWNALQELLAALREVADEVGADVAQVASAWCLGQRGVRACIVGIRSTRHVGALTALRDGVALNDDQMARLEAVRSRFPEVPGAVYALERDRDGRHGRIMKYGLNEATA